MKVPKPQPKLLITVTMLVLAVALGLLWWHARNKSSDVDSYDACTKAGNAVLDSYPSVCVTKDGKRFTNPKEQNLNLKNLVIVQWDLNLPLVTAISDATYTYNASDDSVYLSARGLESAMAQIKGCKSGLHGITYVRAIPGDKDQNGQTMTATDLAQRGIAIGDYYYYEERLAEPMCATEMTGQAQIIQTDQTTLRAAFSHATLNSQ